MYHIVINIKPFVYRQKVSVYQGNECVETIKVPIDEIPLQCKALSFKYNISKIILANKSFYNLNIKNTLIEMFNEDMIKEISC